MLFHPDSPTICLQYYIVLNRHLQDSHKFTTVSHVLCSLPSLLSIVIIRGFTPSLHLFYFLWRSLDNRLASWHTAQYWIGGKSRMMVLAKGQDDCFEIEIDWDLVKSGPLCLQAKDRPPGHIWMNGAPSQKCLLGMFQNWPRLAEMANHGSDGIKWLTLRQKWTKMDRNEW